MWQSTNKLDGSQGSSHVCWKILRGGGGEPMMVKLMNLYKFIFGQPLSPHLLRAGISLKHT